jgi:hypothetical protein
MNAGAGLVTADDIGEYCRRVEDHLTRVNGGHLVRIVGPGFELVRQWAIDGVPLRVVLRGIDLKAERHRSGSARRPLRIEFCAGDVGDVLREWRRAVGVWQEAAAQAAPDDAGERRRPSMTKHLDRILDRLGRTAGRLDLPGALLEALGPIMQDVAELREAWKRARGSDRDALVPRFGALDRRLAVLAREAAPAGWIAAARRDAEQDLAGYRGRLSGSAWTEAVEATTGQLLRERLGLPTVEAP